MNFDKWKFFHWFIMYMRWMLKKRESGKKRTTNCCCDVNLTCFSVSLYFSCVVMLLHVYSYSFLSKTVRFSLYLWAFQLWYVLWLLVLLLLLSTVAVLVFCINVWYVNGIYMHEQKLCESDNFFFILFDAHKAYRMAWQHGI